jgi:hypothetical protein
MLLMVLLNCFPFSAKSQEINLAESDTIHLDSVMDSVLFIGFQQIDSVSITQPVIIQPFKPNPTRAVLYSAVFPGLGQAYNRKHWKLPIVYGGFMGFTYAISWNNKNLTDCGEAYKDLAFDLENHKNEPEKWHQSWQNFVASGRDPAERFNENFKTQLKRWRDLYRRNRDLSIIMAAGFYLICMADAYVDAQLFDFDISPDLSLRVEPVLSPGTNYSPRLYGFHCSIKF